MSGQSDFGTFPVGSSTSITAMAPVGVHLFVRIVASNAHGSAASNEINFTIGEIAVPGAPTLTATQAIVNPVTLNWVAGPGGVPTSYTLRVGTATGQADLGSFGMGQATTISASAPLNVPIFVSVIASNSAGTATSNEVSFEVESPPTPPRPTLQPPIVTGRTVQFAWTNTSPGASYTLRARQSVHNFPGPVIASIPVGQSTSFSVSSVPYGTFFVSVEAHTATGTVESNTQLIHVTAPPPPPAPTLQAPVVTGRQVFLSWIPAGPVSGYLLVVRSAPSGPVITAPRLGPETSLTAPDVPDGRYHVTVQAIHTDGLQVSEPSNEVVVNIP